MGYPTANISITDGSKLIPGNGVYAVEVLIADETADPNSIAHRTSDIVHHKSMMNIGFRPTVDGTKKVIEVNMFDFDGDIYNKIVRVYVKNYLRSEKKFNGLAELKDQLSKDKMKALEALNNVNYEKLP